MASRRLAFLAVLLLACGATLTPQQRLEGARPAIAELQAGRFDAAERAAEAALSKDDANPHARVVRAFTRYKKTGDALFAEVLSSWFGRLLGGRGRHHSRDLGADFARLRAAGVAAERELELVDDDLAVAEKDPAISLELCLACWEIDWNHDGRVDERDLRLFEIEEDVEGQPIPEGDPRRRPTFRFDVGDVAWARAMIAFQRAALDMALAYRWEDIAAFRLRGAEPASELVIRLDDGSRVKRARSLILDGLDHADRARLAYLAETDDDREWVPNPRQKNHPLPLPVDEDLYGKWEAIVADVRRLVRGEEGLDVAQLVALSGESLRGVPQGYLDVGRLLSDPHDIRVDVSAIIGNDRDAERLMRGLFQSAYVSKMRRSPLPARLARMQKEIERGEERLGRKLRYLLWLN